MLARCSSSLKREIICDDVWKTFIKRMSPSLLVIPMRTVSNWRDKFKVLLQKPVLKNDKEVLRLHLVLKVNGVVHSVTLGNPRVGRLEYEFVSGQNFESKFPFTSIFQGSVMILLTYYGMTSVLLPESNIGDNFNGGSGGEFILEFDKLIGSLEGYVIIQFKMTVADRSEYPEEDCEVLTGVKSVQILIDMPREHSTNVLEEVLDMETLIAERLKWY